MNKLQDSKQRVWESGKLEFGNCLEFRNSNLGFLYFMINERQENLISKPAVVVILGHVDHGKTSLLLAIRKMEVPREKPGGVITQHIGAFEVERDNKKITFIDTPGHEAFSAMRARGAEVADIAILVVAADEGVKEQTKEAIAFIKKAGLPMIVVINKIDKAEANPEKVKRELLKEGVLVEELGGKIPSVQISAKTGQNIEELLDLILLVAEMEELKANFEKPAEGVIIEAYLDNQRGPTATLLVREGILKLGDIIGTDSTFGKIKILEDFQEKQIEKAFPSMPVIVLGFENVPQVGEKFKVYFDLETCQKEIEKKLRKRKEREVFEVEPDKKVLNLILKADVVGSLEAIENLLKNLPQEKVILRILKKGVGEINETDIKLAKPAKAKILGFRVKVNPIAKNLAEKEKIRILNFEVIYELAQAVRQLMEKILETEIVRENLGKVKILVVFRTERNRQIVGAKVIEGEIRKGSSIEILRKEEKIGQGKIINLQKDKKDVEVCQKGQECGILYKGEVKIEKDDLLNVYIEEKKKGEL